jgi:flagellar biosynthesis protein FlhG
MLFDGDLGLANVDIQLGLMPEHDIGDVINGSRDLKGVAMPLEERGITDGAFDIIPGKSGSGALGTMAREKLGMIKAGLTALGASYDHIILDLAAGVDAGVTMLSDHKGVILVVLTADPTSLTDAYAFIKITVMRDPEADIRIVVNMANSQREGERAYETIKKACESFLKFSPPLAGVIKSDKKIVDAIRNQTPLLVRHPQSDAAAAVTEIARGFPARRKALAG